MTLSQIVVFIIGPALAYLLGAVPFALLIGKAHGVDIRTVGSKNIGATNLGRTLGIRYFFQAFFLDALKGFLPVFVVHMIGQRAGLPEWAALISGLTAMLGHIFPIYLGFKGGKGVATTFGIVMGLWPVFTLAGIAATIVFVLIFFGWRYISLASVIGSLFFSAFVIWFSREDVIFKTRVPDADFLPLACISLILTLLIIVRHRANIGRLLKGTEPKFGQKKK